MKGDHLGFVVVTYNQADGKPELEHADLYDDMADAVGERDRRQEETETAGRHERHVIADVIERFDQRESP